MKPSQNIFSILSQYGQLFIYFFLFLFILFFQIGIQSFSSAEILVSFYSVIAIGVTTQLICLFGLQSSSLRKWLERALLFLDLVFISYLNLKFNLSTSLFFSLSLFLIFLGAWKLNYRFLLIYATLASGLFLTQSWWQEDFKTSVYFTQVLFYLVAFWCLAYFSLRLREIFESQQSGFEDLRNLNELIVESMPTGLLLLSADGTIQLANKKMEDYFSWNANSEKIFQYFPDLAKRWSPDQAPIEKEIDFLKQGAEVKHLKFAFYPLVTGQLLALVSDLTLVRKLEDQLRQSEKMSAIGQLAAGIAHEIRNPLTGISGSLELLSPQTLTDEDQKLKKIVLREIQRLNLLISDFLDFAKPDKVPNSKVELKPLLESVIFNLQPIARQQSIEIQFKETQVPAILGDENSLNQCFLNFIKNAIEASAARDSILVNLSQDSEHVVVRILDQGPGMDAATQKKMFDPFFTTKNKGTGLGLAMTYKILESHQAKVEVESSQEKIHHGTEIKVFFKKIRD